MTSIYLIRHAEAEGNLFRRAQGHWNGKITARGKKQIDALAEPVQGRQDRRRVLQRPGPRGGDRGGHTARA